jgi:hypothetical protein
MQRGKNACEIVRGHAIASITDILAVCASGTMFPPILIYPYKTISPEITKGVPDDCGVGHRPAGWLTAEVVYKYTGNFPLRILENIMSSSLLTFLLMDTAPI